MNAGANRPVHSSGRMPPTWRCPSSCQRKSRWPGEGLGSCGRLALGLTSPPHETPEHRGLRPAATVGPTGRAGHGRSRARARPAAPGRIRGRPCGPRPRDRRAERTCSPDTSGTDGSRRRVSVDVSLPSAVRHGYGLRLRASAGGRTVVATSAVEAIDGWWQSPRHAALTEFRDPAASAAAVRGLVGWHVTVAQHYDWMWRHYRYRPPGGQERFMDALGREVSHAAVRAAVGDRPRRRCGFAGLRLGLRSRARVRAAASRTSACSTRTASRSAWAGCSSSTTCASDRPGADVSCASIVPPSATSVSTASTWTPTVGPIGPGRPMGRTSTSRRSTLRSSMQPPPRGAGAAGRAVLELRRRGSHSRPWPRRRWLPSTSSSGPPTGRSSTSSAGSNGRQR